jgi:TolB-like protein
MTPRRTLLAAATLAAALTVVHPLRADARGTALMVLYFDNNTGNKDFDNLSKGLADMMITDLSSVPSLTIVEREKLDAILKELKLQRTKYFDPKTAQRIGKGAGAAFVVSGAFLSVAPDLRLDVRVIKLETGTVVKSATVTGKQQAFFELQQKLTAQLVDGLAEVLSKADADRARAAATENRVDNVQTVIDYGKGLEARDSGDLQAASLLMQQVVSKSPEFKLGKARYMEIMKELYSAKSRRASLLSDSEQRLLDHIAAELKKGSAASSKRALAYRVLNGQYHLNRVASNPKRPAAEIRDHLRAYVDNQVVLINETKGMSEYPFGSAALSSEDQKLAEELGINQPGSTFGSKSPSEMMRRLHAVLMFGEPSTFDVNVMPTERVCYYQLDPSYPKLAFAMMDMAIDHIAKHDRRYRERETMRALREYASGLVAVGRQEEAIAKLQSGLTQFPKSDEFAATEKMIREILAGEKPGWGCKAPK